jgi:hypothetical protein
VRAHDRKLTAVAALKEATGTPDQVDYPAIWWLA